MGWALTDKPQNPEKVLKFNYINELLHYADNKYSNPNQTLTLFITNQIRDISQ